MQTRILFNLVRIISIAPKSETRIQGVDTFSLAKHDHKVEIIHSHSHIKWISYVQFYYNTVFRLNMQKRYKCEEIGRNLYTFKC